MTVPGTADLAGGDVPRRYPPLPGPAAAQDDPASLGQGTPAWAAARLGHVTASRVADVVARTRAGFAAARAAYGAQLLAERLSGRAADPYLTSAMAWGRRHEAGARAAYEFFRGVEVGLCGFLRHPHLAMTGASPDGLVGDDGLLEIKCPTTAAHLDLLLKGAIPDRHQLQMQWQMACSGRAWCDYLSFDPRLPEPARLVIIRLARDAARIAALERDVADFLAELDAREAFLRGGPRPPVAISPGTADSREAAAAGEPPPKGPTANPPRRETAAAPSVREADPPESAARSRAQVAAADEIALARRKPLSPRQRLALYEAHQGRCCICGNRIIGERWVDEHIRPLALGGGNELANRAPAHERCAQEKTRDDLRRLAKAKAQKRAHLGIKAPTRPIPSRPFPKSERIRPNLSPLGPPRAARRPEPPE